MFGMEQIGVAYQVAVVLAPLVAYFFFLGLLNSQDTPQILSARTDFILLNAAFLPALLVPSLNYIGASVSTLVIVLLGVIVVVMIAAPARRGNWVIYNITFPEALRATGRALQVLEEPFKLEGRRIVLLNRDAIITFSSMPLLRNVSISIKGNDAKVLHERFAAALTRQLADVKATISPMAMTFLLIATAMMVVPLGFLADRVPEMVRLITDLLR